MSLRLFDTHTHFDLADFDPDRDALAIAAKALGVERLVLIGFVQSRFALVTAHSAALKSITLCSAELFSAGFASVLYRTTSVRAFK